MSNDTSQRVQSGAKFRNERGTSVIKDGIKQRKAQPAAPAAETASTSQPLERKPKWLRARIPGGERFEAVKKKRRQPRFEHRVCRVALP